MDIKTASSGKNSVDEIIEDINSQLGFFDTEFLVFFASSKFNPEEISAKMQDSFPVSQIIGCSTAGEIIQGKLLNDSVVVMAFNSGAIEDVKVEVVENLQDEGAVKKAFSSFESHFNVSMTEMDPQKYVGIVLVDGLSCAEEGLMECIGDLTNVIFIGGSAGDDLKFKSTHVFTKGKCFTNAAVLALLKPRKEFTFIKAQSFRDLNKTLEVTKADEARREVVEFNGKPAAIAYAEAVGTTVDEAPKKFMLNPLGLIIDDEPYVRSPQQIKSSGSMSFYCGVLEGTELSLLESTDIISDTRKAIEQAKDELGTISAVININCILRTLEITQKNLVGEYEKLFSGIQTVGLSSYGEQYIGHINQTATMLAFQ
jgi:hypothetical protein